MKRSASPPQSAPEANHADHALSLVAPEPADGQPSSTEATDSPLVRADLLGSDGRWVDAVALYEAVPAGSAEELGAAIGLGTAQRALGKFDLSEQALRRAIRLAPESSEAHHQLGITLFRRGNYAAAAIELRRTTEIDPGCAPALHLLGEALNQTGEPVGARTALERATELQPSNGKAFYALGIALDRMGEPERAAEMYRRSRDVGR